MSWLCAELHFKRSKTAPVLTCRSIFKDMLKCPVVLLRSGLVACTVILLCSCTRCSSGLCVASPVVCCFVGCCRLGCSLLLLFRFHCCLGWLEVVFTQLLKNLINVFYKPFLIRMLKESKRATLICMSSSSSRTCCASFKIFEVVPATTAVCAVHESDIGTRAAIINTPAHAYPTAAGNHPPCNDASTPHLQRVGPCCGQIGCYALFILAACHTSCATARLSLHPPTTREHVCATANGSPDENALRSSINRLAAWTTQ